MRFLDFWMKYLLVKCIKLIGNKLMETVIDLTDVQIFQGHNLILSDVDVKIGQGEFVYLIGQTGSGKSSLLKTLYGEIKLEKGTGSIAGFDLTKLKPKDIPYLRRKLGIVLT